jgi:hypothetical protein
MRRWQLLCCYELANLQRMPEREISAQHKPAVLQRKAAV